MGAWDFGSFDNDNASDWLYELEKSSDASVIASALRAVAEIGEAYLEAPACAEALAAAEMVAALRGHPLAGLPEEAEAWVEAHRGLDVASLVSLAQSVIERIRNHSELKELWEETKDAGPWYATLDDLSTRLRSP